MTEDTKLIEEAIQELKDEFKDSSFVIPTVTIKNYFCGYDELHRQVLKGFNCIVKTVNREFSVMKFVK